MGWLSKLRTTRDLPKVARDLPAALSRDYGRSKVYTIGQLTTAMDKARVRAELRPFILAAYLSEPEYRLQVADPDEPYDQARRSFLRAARKVKSTYAFEQSSDNSGSVMDFPSPGF